MTWISPEGLKFVRNTLVVGILEEFQVKTPTKALEEAWKLVEEIEKLIESKEKEA